MSFFIANRLVDVTRVSAVLLLCRIQISDLSPTSWDGDDGPWSTFALRVGTPEQVVRVLPSTAVPETWVVFDAGCISTDPKSCPDDRGGTFNFNVSTTWVKKDFFSLAIELNLGYDTTNAGEYGFETLGLGYQGSGGPSLENQVIAGIATKDFYLGSLGLNPRPLNFTTEDSHPTLLANLRTQNLVPSLSYGYSAGAYYRLKKVDGSLVLGGYDQSLFTPNDVEFKFASDISRDLVVGLQSIKFSDSKTTDQVLLSEGILTFIDSTVPHIWLPVKVCQAFEQAFGLNYDEKSGLYLVNDTLHDKLLAQNANVTFTLGDQVNGGKTVDITLPYLSFDLQASYKFLDNASKYFPLRRAANDTQFTLGRTFLQESYLIVDYERSNFSVSQAIFQENAEQKLVPIISVNDTSPNITISNNNPPPGPTASKKISTGAIAGIVIAIVILCILVLGAALFLIRRRRREKLKAETQDPTNQPELDGITKPIFGELHEADSQTSKINLEMDGSKPIPALDANHRRLAEVPGTTGGAEMEASHGGVEMETGHPSAVELDAGPITPYELATSDAPTSELPSPSISRLPSPPISREKPLPSPLSNNKPLPSPLTNIPTSPFPSPSPDPSPSSTMAPGRQVGSSAGTEAEAEAESRVPGGRMKWSLRKRRGEGL